MACLILIYKGNHLNNQMKLPHAALAGLSAAGNINTGIIDHFKQLRVLIRLEMFLQCKIHPCHQAASRIQKIAVRFFVQQIVDGDMAFDFLTE